MTQEMIEFLKDEFGIIASRLDDYGPEKHEELYAQCCDIEVEEALKGDPISDRGRIAADLVTYLYQTYAEPLEE